MDCEGDSCKLRLDLSKPRYDQSTYIGRAKHFFQVTNPLNLLTSSAELEKAKNLVESYKANKEPSGTKIEDVWRAKTLYDSAYHPDTKEKQIIIGRMSAQVPCNAILTAAMLTFYKSTPAVVFWQWINQSFNAIVNYTNRSGGSDLSTKDVTLAYLSATGGAVGTALGLKSFSNKMPPLFAKLIPFIAVAAANCINIPLMRSHELINGIPLINEKGQQVAVSKDTAKYAISMVVISRIIMASPSFVIPPILLNQAVAKYPIFKTPRMSNLLQLLLVVACLTFATPLCCAIFPQQASVKVGCLEEGVKNDLLSKGYSKDTSLNYNKGL